VLTKYLWTACKSLWLLALGSAVAACGGEWSEYEPDTAKLPEDTVKSVSYPSGPYGTNEGDKIKNLAFTNAALMDPDTMCKKTADLDISQVRGVSSLALLDLYKGSPYCPSKKKQLLWVTVTAGW
jgi:hypothetical protein